jgi:hypothetical protein
MVLIRESLSIIANDHLRPDIVFAGVVGAGAALMVMLLVVLVVICKATQEKKLITFQQTDKMNWGKKRNE